MNPRNTAIKELNDSGYISETKYSIPLKRGHFDEDDLRYIRKEIRQGGR